MIKTFLDLLQFLFTNAQLLTSTLILTLLSIYLAKSIKKNPKTYYFILAIPFFLVAIPFTLNLLGAEVLTFTRVPVLGHILRDYIHWGTFGHPLFIIVMYMGALNPKISFVKRLMSIRKELSIIAGFPVLTHTLVRIFNNFPNAWLFFVDNDEFMANNLVVSELGTAFTNFSFVFGVLIFVLFLPLWITSFDAVRKRMSAIRWKKLQKWAYVFYATLFIHAMAIAVGGILNSPPERPRQAVEVSVSAGTGRALPASITDYHVSRQTRRYIQVVTLLLIYGSYVVLRVRKARRSKRKKLK